MCDLVHLSRKAMAGEFEICLPISTAGEATAAGMKALDLIQSLERQLSYFRPESEISQINRTAAEREVEVEPRLFGLLQLAMRVWQESGGAYDLTAAPLWEAWGFARREGAIPQTDDLAAAKDLVGSQWVELGRAAEHDSLPSRGRAAQSRKHRQGLRRRSGRRARCWPRA